MCTLVLSTCIPKLAVQSEGRTVLKVVRNPELVAVRWCGWLLLLLPPVLLFSGCKWSSALPTREKAACSLSSWARRCLLDFEVVDSSVACAKNSESGLRGEDASESLSAFPTLASSLGVFEREWLWLRECRCRIWLPTTADPGRDP